jgi:hypothetical protein
LSNTGCGMVRRKAEGAQYVGPASVVAQGNTSWKRMRIKKRLTDICTQYDLAIVCKLSAQGACLTTSACWQRTPAGVESALSLPPVMC